MKTKENKYSAEAIAERLKNSVEKAEALEEKIRIYNEQNRKSNKELEFECKQKNELEDLAFRLETATLNKLSERLDVALKENDRELIDLLKIRIVKMIDNKIDEMKFIKRRIEKL